MVGSLPNCKLLPVSLWVNWGALQSTEDGVPGEYVVLGVALLGTEENDL